MQIALVAMEESVGWDDEGDEAVAVSATANASVALVANRDNLAFNGTCWNRQRVLEIFDGSQSGPAARRAFRRKSRSTTQTQGTIFLDQGTPARQLQLASTSAL